MHERGVSSPQTSTKALKSFVISIKTKYFLANISSFFIVVEFTNSRIKKNFTAKFCINSGLNIALSNAKKIIWLKNINNGRKE
jgi:hypothetical protein